MRFLLVALLCALSYAQTAYLGFDDFDTYEDYLEWSNDPCTHAPAPCKNGAKSCTSVLGDDYDMPDAAAVCECADGFSGGTCENVADPHPVFNNVALIHRDTGEIVPASCGGHDRHQKLVHGRVAMVDGIRSCVDLNSGTPGYNSVVKMCAEHRGTVCCEEDEILVEDHARYSVELVCKKPSQCVDTATGKIGYSNDWDDFADSYNKCDVGDGTLRRCGEGTVVCCFGGQRVVDNGDWGYYCTHNTELDVASSKVNLHKQNKRLRKANAALLKTLKELSAN